MKQHYFSFLVFENQINRLDQFLCTAMKSKNFSRERIKKIILSNGCRINDVICSSPNTKLKPGMIVILEVPDNSSSLEPEDGALEILYQDEYLIVINKPPGLTVHPAPSCPKNTLVHRLIKHFPQIALQGGDRPGIVHRIDKDTSGLLCIALTEEVRLRLVELFASRKVDKEYLAIVHGVPPISGLIKASLGRDPRTKVKVAVISGGKFASTEWNVLYSGKNRLYSLIKLKIHTGRTHQIRVHMKHIGHPLIGDQVYTDKKYKNPRYKRQMLHAWKLSFNHPITMEKLQFLCPPPKNFFDTLDELEQKTSCIVLTGLAGSGKTTALEEFKKQGIVTWSADSVVTKLYNPGGEVWNILKERYGNQFVVDDSMPVDKQKLIEAMNGISHNSLTISELNDIVHPIVLHEMITFWHQSFLSGYSYAIAEVPLWFDVEPLFKQLIKKTKYVVEEAPIIIGIVCPEAKRHNRLFSTRGWSNSFQEMIDGWQIGQEEKFSRCHYLVNNSGTISELTIQVDKIIKKLQDNKLDAQKAYKNFLFNLMSR